MAKAAEPPKERFIPNALKFAFGGLAGMAATCVVQPLDLIKTRMQLSGGGRSSFAIGGDCGKGRVHGIVHWSIRWSAETGNLHHYTSRVYTWLFDSYKQSHGGATPGFIMKAALGVAAGSFGAFVGTPAEVALIRMTADGRLPKDQRRNYRNVADALIRIIKEEGVPKLWRGATPTVVRAMVVNAAQLGTYSQAREMFVGKVPDGIILHFCASMVSGLVTTIASMPIDIIKTKVQNAAKGQSQYAVVANLLAKEGVLSLWKGFLPYYARLGPHTVLVFIFLEQLNSAYFRYS